MPVNDSDTSGAHKNSLSVDLRWVVGFLLLVIVALVFLWKPWTANPADARTVEVHGEAKLSATPDEFIFNPTYTFENADKNKALSDLTEKSNLVVAKLKELGVPEKKIKTNSSGNAYYGPAIPEKEESGSTTYTLQLTVTVGSTELAQKVQDYLVSTTPTGSVSPQANFSDEKRKQLEATARTEALKDGRTKAEAAAKELGFSVDKVKSVSDGSFSIYPMLRSSGTEKATDSIASLSIQAGENELPYSVTVIYFIK